MDHVEVLRQMLNSAGQERDRLIEAIALLREWSTRSKPRTNSPLYTVLIETDLFLKEVDDDLQ